MSVIELAGDVRVALSHLCAYGLAAILEDHVAGEVTVGWSEGLDARPIVDAPDLEADQFARVVLEHARRHADASSWTAATAEVGGSTVGRMSPRIKAPPDDETWLRLVRLRRETIDSLVAERRWLDLALIGALGEPAHWRRDLQGKRPAHYGASRWEMTTRNKGGDFVARRLRRLAGSVAARDAASVREGLEGVRVRDEVGADAVDSRTATGLAGLGATDNAVAWCALWGISLLPLAPRTDRPSETAGHVTSRSAEGRRQGWFHLPVTAHPVTLARLRTVIVSSHLATAALGDGAGLAVEASRRWLIEHRVAAVVRFPIAVFGSASAPEPRALTGTVVAIRS